MAFPTTSLLDNFNRANANLASGNGPLAWVVAEDSGSGPAEVVSNQAGQTQATSLRASRSGTTYGNDQELWATLTALPGTAGRYIRFYLRYSTTLNGYLCQFVRGSGSVLEFHIYKEVGGSITELATATVNQTVALGDGIGFSVIGTTLQMWYKPTAGSWTAIRTVTDTTFSTGSRVGIGFGDTIARIDDLGGGTANLAGVITPSPINATSTVTARVTALKKITPGGIAATSTVSGGITGGTPTVTLAASTFAYFKGGTWHVCGSEALRDMHYFRDGIWRRKETEANRNLLVFYKGVWVA